MVQRRGDYPPPPGAPRFRGSKWPAPVAATGADVPDELLGQPVCALIAGGGYAEYAWRRSANACRCRAALTMVEAAAMPETCSPCGPTCSSAPTRREGETVLVHGGTSGIGTMAIALGDLFGLGSSSPAAATRNAAAREALGAEHAINYKSEDFVAGGGLTGGKGVEVVLDMVGGDYVPRNSNASPMRAGMFDRGAGRRRPRSRSSRSCAAG